MAKQMEAIATSESVEDLFQRLERAGVLLRLDPDVEPTMYHAATISRQELDELRRIDQVIRMGRVQRITEDEILLDGGTLPTTAGTVHVDCTASAVGNLDPVPVFQSDRIVPQTIRSDSSKTSYPAIHPSSYRTRRPSGSARHCTTPSPSTVS